MPIIIDGADTLLRLFVVLIWGRDFKEHKVSDDQLPHVTILVPAYNEEKIINRCLNSIKIQDYPHNKLEVIVIDDGSHDATALEVATHISGSRNGKNGNSTNGANSNGSTNVGTAYEFETRFDGGSSENGAARNGYNTRVNGKNNNGCVTAKGNRLPLPEEFTGSIKLLSNGHVGKPRALNAGIRHMNHSDLVMTIDSDVVLAPNAIRNAASAFMENPKMGAATGNIEINTEILEERDPEGKLVLDEEGRITTKKLGFSEKILAHCQFLEYLDAFRLGRQFQSLIHSTYILAGAFSIFRRDVLEETPLYRSHTVSEDFDLTVDIHKKQVHIGYIPDAKAYLEPVVEWDSLYSQRVRWCRGQLEVCGVHKDIIGNRAYGPIGWFGFPQMLIVDHTFAFPRLIWTFLLLFFPLFGYPPRTIATAIFFMYLFYVGLAFLQTMSAYFIVDGETKTQIERTLSFCFVLPVYRLITFYFRMSGYLLALTEPAQWQVEGPLKTLRKRVTDLRSEREIAWPREVLTTLANLLAPRRKQSSHTYRLPQEESAPQADEIDRKREEKVLDIHAVWQEGYKLIEEGRYEEALILFKNAVNSADELDDLLLLHIELAKLNHLQENSREAHLELDEAVALCKRQGEENLAREIDCLLATISK